MFRRASRRGSANWSRPEEIPEFVIGMHGEKFRCVDPHAQEMTSPIEVGPVGVVRPRMQHRAVVEHEGLAGLENESQREVVVERACFEQVKGCLLLGVHYGFFPRNQITRILGHSSNRPNVADRFDVLDARLGKKLPRLCTNHGFVAMRREGGIVEAAPYEVGSN